MKSLKSLFTLVLALYLCPALVAEEIVDEELRQEIIDEAMEKVREAQKNRDIDQAKIMREGQKIYEENKHLATEEKLAEIKKRAKPLLNKDVAKAFVDTTKLDQSHLKSVRDLYIDLLRRSFLPPEQKDNAEKIAAQKEGPVLIECDGETFFDSQNKTAVLQGEIKVYHPDFYLTCDRLDTFFNPQTGGLEEVIASGYVTIDRSDFDPETGLKVYKVGKARKAVYNVARGDIVMSIYPQLQEGQNLQYATAADTVLIIKDGNISWKGASAVSIQEQKNLSGSKP